MFFSFLKHHHFKMNKSLSLKSERKQKSKSFHSYSLDRSSVVLLKKNVLLHFLAFHSVHLISNAFSKAFHSSLVLFQLKILYFALIFHLFILSYSFILQSNLINHNRLLFVLFVRCTFYCIFEIKKHNKILLKHFSINKSIKTRNN